MAETAASLTPKPLPGEREIKNLQNKTFVFYKQRVTICKEGEKMHIQYLFVLALRSQGEAMKQELQSPGEQISEVRCRELHLQTSEPFPSAVI